MVETAVQVSAHILTAMFVVGFAGCIFVIPTVAYKLFQVLFEADGLGEE